jgi:L-ascorbate metabolism protein UlaG (beta-lactamase superfamily)
MKITYFGHSCFLLETKEGTRILIDPFDEQARYPIPRVEADLVLISHEHFDHNHVPTAAGSRKVIRGLANDGQDFAEISETFRDVKVSTIPTYHDDTRGSQRGKNAMFWIETNGVEVLHAGDLGHDLDNAAARAAKSPDILMIPVGGYYTIDAKTADSVIDRIRPRVVIPMHYKTEVNEDWPIATIDRFLQGKRGITRVGHQVKALPLPDQREVWVMDWKEKT